MIPARTYGGFTLGKKTIVEAIIGLLAILAIPNITKARTTTQLNECLENQRILFGAASIYELEQRTNLSSVASSGVAIRNAIIASGYVVKSNAFDCPASGVLD